MRGYGPSFSSPPLYLGSFSLFLIFHFSFFISHFSFFRSFSLPHTPFPFFHFSFYFLLFTSYLHSSFRDFILQATSPYPPVGDACEYRVFKKKKMYYIFHFQTHAEMWLPLDATRQSPPTPTYRDDFHLGCSWMWSATMFYRMKWCLPRRYA